MKHFSQIIRRFNLLLLLLIASTTSTFAIASNQNEFMIRINLNSSESQTIPLLIQNEDALSHKYNLRISSTQNDYETHFFSNGSEVKGITLPSGSTAEVDLKINTKGNTFLNQELLLVKAIREDGSEKTIPISILINKEYRLNVKSMLPKIDLLNGKAGELTFSITNAGTKDLKSVKLETELPYKWIVSQSDKNIAHLSPGETVTTKITVEVPSSQATGNFNLKFKAVSDEVKSSSISIPVTVKTNTNIAYWMLGGLILIAIFTGIQFKRHGRR